MMYRVSLKFNVPPNTLEVISGTSFHGSNYPTNSFKALKEDRSKRLGFNPIRSIPVLTIIQQLCSVEQKHTKYAQINTNKSTQ